MESYWQLNNPMSKVFDITVPCMCLNSEADPVIEKGMIPYKAFANQPNSLLVTLSHGGHCGFIAEGLTHWADTLSLNYVTTATKFGKS